MVGRKLNNYLYRRRLRNARGTVKAWHGDKGWGVLTSPDAPAEVWVHFSAIEGSGYKELRVGDSVEFEYHHVANQDGTRTWLCRRVDSSGAVRVKADGGTPTAHL